VRLQSTTPAKGRSTIAFNICYYRVNVFLITKLTAFHRAPFNALVIICVRFAKSFPVSFKNFWLGSKESFKKTMTYFHVASCLHAFSFNARKARFDYLLKIVLPTLFAKIVLAIKTELEKIVFECIYE
jgi:hypothetical protein